MFFFFYGCTRFKEYSEKTKTAWPEEWATENAILEKNVTVI